MAPKGFPCIRTVANIQRRKWPATGPDREICSPVTLSSLFLRFGSVYLGAAAKLRDWEAILKNVNYSDSWARAPSITVTLLSEQGESSKSHGESFMAVKAGEAVYPESFFPATAGVF